MNEIAFREAVEKLEQVFTNILFMRPEEMLCAPNTQHLTDIKARLNDIFEGDIVCTDVLYSLNTDKEYFGLTVNPLFNSVDALNILTTSDPVKCKMYQIEFDSKIFDAGLAADELTASVLYEISSMLCNPELVNEVRALIDLHVLANDDVIHIRDSANYSQLIIYALKDTYYKVSSLLFKEEVDDLLVNDTIQKAQLGDALISAQEKLINNVYGSSDTLRSPKTIILKWMFMVYKDMKHNSRLIKDTLKEAKDFTASLLKKQEIDKTILAIDRIDAQTVIESVNINKFIDKKMSKLNEASIFKSLKQSGLRSIEDDFYELSIRAKAVEDEEDALFVLRAINTRLSILEDYIYNTELSEQENKKWSAVANNYRMLREQLTKSKVFKKKSYGLFFDYNQLDQYDESFSFEPVQESIFTKYIKIPTELKMTESVITNGSSYKSALDKLVKYLVDNNAPEKQISATLKIQYYAVVGNVFGNGINSKIPYNNQCSYLAKYIAKYCNDRDKNQIAKDIEKTIAALDKTLQRGNDLTKLQQAWYNDIKKVIKIIK